MRIRAFHLLRMIHNYRAYFVAACRVLHRLGRCILTFFTRDGTGQLANQTDFAEFNLRHCQHSNLAVALWANKSARGTFDPAVSDDWVGKSLKELAQTSTQYVYQKVNNGASQISLGNIILSLSNIGYFATCTACSNCIESSREAPSEPIVTP